MNSRNIFLGLAIGALLFSAGCVTTDKERTLLGLSVINEQIAEGTAESTVLEAGVVTETGAAEVAADPFLVTKGGDDNPYLRGFKRVQKHEVKPEVKEGIMLNFDNADIYEVIQVIAETLNLNYIIDPQVKGVVNIRSGRKIPLSQLFITFKKILNINGLDIRSAGDYYFIYVAKASSPLSINSPAKLDSLTESPRMVMQVVPVMHLSSAEAIRLIAPYLSEKGVAYSLDAQNMILLHDFESKVIDAVIILSRLDISPLASLKLRAIKVDNVPLFDVHEEMTEILRVMGVNKQDFEGVSIIPLERVNTLLLIGKNSYLLDNVERWVNDLDVIPDQGRDTLNIYNVRNSVASELAELVSAMISEDKTVKTKDITGKPTPKSNILPASMHFAGKPVLFPDDSRNIIIIRALAPDYSRIVKILERLDNMPRQVLIEVLVAEIKLTDSWELGVEWSLRNKLKMDSSTYDQEFATNFDQIKENITGGFTYAVLRGAGNPVALLNAIAAETELSVLSSPQILVLNNETAMVNVGDQVPIITSETQNLADGTRVDRTVQYRDTGTILSVTPRINYNGMIILNINQQVSHVGKIIEGGVGSPVISTRELDTKLAVKNGQSILIGGLIKKDIDRHEGGIPLLKDIPGLGWLFKYQSEKITRTELLIMITPYVIASENVLDQYIRQFNATMQGLRRELVNR